MLLHNNIYTISQDTKSSDTAPPMPFDFEFFPALAIFIQYHTHTQHLSLHLDTGYSPGAKLEGYVPCCT